MWLSASAVRARYRGQSNNPIGATTLMRWVAAGKLPQPVKIGLRNFWEAEQLDRYDQARMPTARQMMDEAA